jgi:hypothetical protein
MFAFIDGLGFWVEVVSVFALGVWSGRRWAKTMMQAKCDARNCDTLIQMRTEQMKLSADKMKTERVNEFMRNTLRQKDETIHSLKTSNGIMGKEIQSMVYQLPRQQRRMVQ